MRVPGISCETKRYDANSKLFTAVTVPCKFGRLQGKEFTKQIDGTQLRLQFRLKTVRSTLDIISLDKRNTVLTEGEFSRKAGSSFYINTLRLIKL